MTSPPQRTDRPLFPISITGYLMPVQKNGRPILLALPGTDMLHIAVFETKDRLDALWRAAPQLPAYDRVVLITDGREFLASVRSNNNPKLVVIADPRMQPNLRVKYIQIFQAGEEVPAGNPS